METETQAQAEQSLKDKYFSKNKWLFPKKQKAKPVFFYGEHLNAFFKGKQTDHNLPYLESGLAKHRLKLGKFDTLRELIELFLEDANNGNLHALGELKSSFAGLASKIRSANNTTRNHVEFLASKGIIKITKKGMSEGIGRKGYAWTSFNFIINPEFLPFIKAEDREEFAKLTTWSDVPSISIDTDKELETHQAKVDQRRSEAESKFAMLNYLSGYDEEKIKLFEKLALLNNEQVIQYFQKRKGNIDSKGKFVKYKDYSENIALLTEFWKWQGQKNQALFQELIPDKWKKSKPKQPIQNDRTENRQPLGFVVSEVKSEVKAEPAPVPMQTVEPKQDMSKLAEMQQKLNSKFASNRGSSSNSNIYETRTTPKPTHEPSPEPSSNILDSRFTYKQREILKTLINLCKSPDKLRQAYQRPDTDLLVIYELVDHYENQRTQTYLGNQIDYSEFTRQTWIWELIRT